MPKNGLTKIATWALAVGGMCNAFTMVDADNQLRGFGDDRPVRMQLVAADSEDGYSFTPPASGAAIRKLRPNSFVRWGQPVRPRLQPFILLSDGSELLLEQAQSVISLNNDRVSFRSDLFADVVISVDSIRAFVLVPPRDHLQRDKLTQRLTTTGPAFDELVLTNGDALRGQLVGFDQDTIEFAIDGRTRNVTRERAAILTLDSRFSKQRAHLPRALIGLNDGHFIFTESISADNRLLQIELFDGTVLKSRSYIRPIDDSIISFVQPLGGHVQYVSDLVPTNFRHIPYLSGNWSHGQNRDLHGSVLVSAESGKRSAKGIAMHSTSRLTFDIPDGYSTFEAELALAADAEGKSLGSVQYRVFLKTRMGWKEVFKSPIVRQSLHEVECRVPLRFAEEIATAISLVVDFADRIDQGDHALWLDARLVR